MFFLHLSFGDGCRFESCRSVCCGRLLADADPILGRCKKGGQHDQDKSFQGWNLPQGAGETQTYWNCHRTNRNDLGDLDELGGSVGDPTHPCEGRSR